MSADRPRTKDGLFGGKLIIQQEERGYRFSIDAVLLAGLSRVHRKDRVADLGTGCGVVALTLAHRGLGRHIVGMEIQPELAQLARDNVVRNGLEDRIDIVEVDLRKLDGHFPPGSFDIALCNPPYRRLHSGRINPDIQKAIARHEMCFTLFDLFRAAQHLLRHRGRLSVIYPANRMADLLLEMRNHHFGAQGVTLIHSHRHSPARLVYLECRKGGAGELRISPPFFIYHEDRTYTEAMKALYEA